MAGVTPESRQVPFTFKLLYLNRNIVVEAAGVEPASEKARNETTTCVSDSRFSSRALEPARRRFLSSINLGLQAPNRNLRPIL
jgi:hypothetical protein